MDYIYEINSNTNQDDLNNKLRGGKNNNCLEKNDDNNKENETFHKDIVNGERREYSN